MSASNKDESKALQPQPKLRVYLLIGRGYWTRSKNLVARVDRWTPTLHPIVQGRGLESIVQPASVNKQNKKEKKKRRGSDDGEEEMWDGEEEEGMDEDGEEEMWDGNGEEEMQGEEEESEEEGGEGEEEMQGDEVDEVEILHNRTIKKPEIPKLDSPDLKNNLYFTLDSPNQITCYGYTSKGTAALLNPIDGSVGCKSIPFKKSSIHHCSKYKNLSIYRKGDDFCIVNDDESIKEYIRLGNQAQTTADEENSLIYCNPTIHKNWMCFVDFNSYLIKVDLDSKDYSQQPVVKSENIDHFHFHENELYATTTVKNQIELRKYDLESKTAKAKLRIGKSPSSSTIHSFGKYLLVTASYYADKSQETTTTFYVVSPSTLTEVSKCKVETSQIRRDREWIHDTLFYLRVFRKSKLKYILHVHIYQHIGVLLARGTKLYNLCPDYTKELRRIENICHCELDEKRQILFLSSTDSRKLNLYAIQLNW